MIEGVIMGVNEGMKRKVIKRDRGSVCGRAIYGMGGRSNPGNNGGVIEGVIRESD